MADVQYAIDIAANLSADATFDELDRLASELATSGRDAAVFEDAMSKVSSQLDDAGRAAADAFGKLADGKAEYKQLERAALNTAKAVERAAAKGRDPTAKQAEAARAAKAALEAYLPTLRKLETGAEQAANAQQRLQQTSRNMARITTRVKDRLGDAATKLSTFRGALGDVGGPLGEFGERLLYPAQAFVDLNEWFGTTVAAGVVLGVGLAAVAAAVVVLTAAMVAGAAAAAAYGVQLADANRKAELAQQAIEAHEPAIKAVSAAYPRLTETTGLATDQLNDLARSLDAAGVSAADMPRALRAVATAEAALGQGGAASFIADLKSGKQSVDELAAATQEKFGGIVARQMLGLESQSARLKREIGETFGGLEIEPVLTGFRTLIDLFDQNTESGRFLKATFEGLFQPIIDQAQNAAYAIEAFFLGIAIGAVRVYNGLRPAIDAITEMLGIDTSEWELEDTLAGITRAGELLAGTVGVVLVGALLAAAVVFRSLSASLASAFAQFAVVKAVVETVAASVLRFQNLGTQIVVGLVRGITSAGGQVADALGGVVNSAIATAKAKLGIASPSKVFAKIGGQTAEGFAAGVDAGAGDADDAMAALVSPTPALRGAAPDAELGGASAGGRTVVIESLTIGDSPVARETWNDFRALLLETLEADTLQIAGAES